MGKKNLEDEVDVKFAADYLGVGPRSVINYIQSKEIKANKVGKEWHINKASLDAFKQRYGFLGKLGDSENNAENSESAERKKPPTRSFPKGENRPKKDIYPVHGLKLFQIAKDTLHNIDPQSLFPKDRPDLHRKFLALKTEALEYLGAGFYAFGRRTKAILYARSREKVGGMLSLIYFYQGENYKVPEKILKIEEELLPAFSSLIRRMEKENERP